ncbi:putative protein phosphatase 2C 45 [Frankliniella fusca]|uniref:HAT C-terminal dimerisation domain-containing protein n=1 Tax=Frankliniella fusca TaxID=407009 RepID=A0AAE1I1I7_9NEOP|nr:putative protein phosphatase 2C 45 [Frankliniella fusca]
MRAKKRCREIRIGGVLSEREISDLRRALEDAGSLLPVSAVDFGAGARILLGQIRIDPKVLENCQTRCVRYLIILVKNLLDILPEQSSRLMAVRYFTPREALRQEGRADVLLLPVGGLDVDVDQLEQEWERLPKVDWVSFFRGEIPKTSVAFWQGVVQYDRMAAEPKFETLTAVAFRALSNPLANADVERAFSFMNAIKTKPRNRMSAKLLEAVLRIRMRLSKQPGCCKGFQPWPEMISLFTSDMYSYDRVAQEEGVEEGGDEGWEEINICALEEENTQIYECE